MLAIIILIVFILLVVGMYMFDKKNQSIKSNNTKKILVIFVIGFVIFFIIKNLTYSGVKYVYCLSNNKCITVWKRINGEIYIIYGKYENTTLPDNYIKVSNLRNDYIDVISVNNKKILINVDGIRIINKSSDGLIEIYNNNRALNDSLYTYFDGKYRRYKKEINYIGINIKENYATDKNGKKIE